MDVGRLIDALLEPLLPTRCGGCGLPGAGVCSACADALAAVRPPLCARCGHPWPEPAPRCRGCLAGLPRTRAAVGYDRRASALVRTVKDHGRRRLADDLAALLVAGTAPPAGHVLVPVPAAPARRRERGFDQAELIARGAGARWGLPVAVVLRRDPAFGAQRGTARSGRLRLAAAAFRAPSGAPPACCLIDDVHTTGATLRAAARALRAAGAARVEARTVARVPAPGAEWWTVPAAIRHPRPVPPAARQVPEVTRVGR